MRKAIIREMDYNEFLKQLATAKREKRYLDPMLDKEAFADEILRRDIKLTAFASIVQSRYQAEEMYLLTGDNQPWDGLFAIDRDTHACLLFDVVDV